jgi:UDP-glucose 4-epimerase
MSITKVIITGGAGNIGGSLARALAHRDDIQLLVIDNLQTGSLDKLPPLSDRVEFVRADVNRYLDVAPVFTSFRPDFVFHYSATVGVARTLQNPMMVLDDIEGLRNVLTLCKGTRVRRAFYASSSEVYGEPVELPQREETTPLNSRLPYAVVKNLGEIYFKTYQREYGVPHTIFRFFNTYGPLQSEDFVISKFIAQALDGGEITLYGDGRQTRTFCYVDDNVDFQILCMDKDLFVNDTVNVGSEIEIEVRELAQLVVELIEPNARIVHRPALPEGDMKRRQPDNSRMLGALGRDLVPLREGILRTADFIRSKRQAKAGDA